MLAQHPPTTAHQTPYTSLDLAVGWLIGWESRPPLPELPPGTNERDVLERALTPLVAAGPVGVPLLGGTSSAIVLATAAAVARRDGHELPIPLSLEFTAPSMRDTASYQARVVAHLGLEDRWERVPAGADLELVGAEAAAVLRAHGPQYPSNVHWMRPMLRRIGGGTLVLGHGRGERFDCWPYGTVWATLRGQRPPSRAALRTAVRAALPRPVRARLSSRHDPAVPWLTPAARRAQARAAREMEPAVRWRDAYLRLRGQRCLAEIPRSCARVAADFGAEVVFPFLSLEMGAAVLSESTATGYRDSEAGQRFFGDLLPADLPLQRDHAAYGGVYYGEQTRAFARSWSGGGLDDSFIDPDALRALWASERHDWRSSALMQTAWLHDNR